MWIQKEILEWVRSEVLLFENQDPPLARDCAIGISKLQTSGRKLRGITITWHHSYERKKRSRSHDLTSLNANIAVKEPSPFGEYCSEEQPRTGRFIDFPLTTLSVPAQPGFHNLHQLSHAPLPYCGAPSHMWNTRRGWGPPATGTFASKWRFHWQGWVITEPGREIEGKAELLQQGGSLDLPVLERNAFFHWVMSPHPSAAHLSMTVNRDRRVMPFLSTHDRTVAP